MQQHAAEDLPYIKSRPKQLLSEKVKWYFGGGFDDDFVFQQVRKSHAFEILPPHTRAQHVLLSVNIWVSFLKGFSCFPCYDSTQKPFFRVGWVFFLSFFFFFKPFSSRSRRSAFIDCHSSMKAWGSKHLWVKPPQKGNSSWLKPYLPTQTPTL